MGSLLGIYQSLFYLWGALWFILLIVATALSVGANYWLKYWTEQNSEGQNKLNVWKFLLVYAGLGLSAAIMTIARSSVMLLWLGINASKKIHDNMAQRVLNAPMQFSNELLWGE